MGNQKLLQGDCLELMKDIPDKSINMILCDLPYGTTCCKWDIVIPFDELWRQYKRVIKDNGAIVLTASQPFTSKLIISNLDMFKYEIIWIKSHPSNSLLCKKQILKYHENICVFYNKQTKYNPQFTIGAKNHSRGKSIKRNSELLNSTLKEVKVDSSGKKYPKSYYNCNSFKNKNKLHPTQKPVSLCEYLIKTYTNEEDLVLDNCMGSGTTGVACKNLNRNFIGMELDEKYFNIATKRINDALE